MKRTTILFLALIFGMSILFGANAVLQINKTKFNNDAMQNGKVNLSIESQSDVKGVEFDIKYNPQELNLTERQIASKIAGIEVYCRIKQEGSAKVLMFSMDGEKILDINKENIVDIIEINFEPVNMFNGTSQIELANIIIAGKAGEQIPATSNAEFDVSYLTPQKTSLSTNYPNPFNPSTTIDYQLSKAGNVSLIIYDLKGSEVKTLVQDYQEAKYHNISWDGINNNGQSVASGRYILKMIASGYVETVTMTLLK